MSLSNKKKIKDLQNQVEIMKETIEYYNQRIDCLTRIIYDNMSYGQIKKINEDAEYNEMTGYEFLVEHEMDLEKEYFLVNTPSLD